MSSTPNHGPLSPSLPRIITSTITNSPVSSKTSRSNSHGSSHSSAMLNNSGLSAPAASGAGASPSSSLSAGAMTTLSPLYPPPEEQQAPTSPPIRNPKNSTAIEGPSTIRGNPMADHAPSSNNSTSRQIRVTVNTPSDTLSRTAFSPLGDSPASGTSYFSSRTRVTGSDWSYSSAVNLTPPLFQGDTDNPPFKASKHDPTSLKMDPMNRRSSTLPIDQNSTNNHCSIYKQGKRPREPHQRSHFGAKGCLIAPTAPVGYRHLCQGHTGSYRPRKFDRVNTDTVARMLPRLESDPPPSNVSRRWSSVEIGTYQAQLKSPLPKKPTNSIHETPATNGSSPFTRIVCRPRRSLSFSSVAVDQDILPIVRTELTLRKVTLPKVEVPFTNLEVPTTITLRRASNNSVGSEATPIANKTLNVEKEMGGDSGGKTPVQLPHSTDNAVARRHSTYLITTNDVDSITDLIEANLKRVYRPHNRISAHPRSHAPSTSDHTQPQRKGSFTSPTIIEPTPSVSFGPSLSCSVVDPSLESSSSTSSTGSRTPRFTSKGMIPQTFESTPTLMVSESLPSASSAQKTQLFSGFLQVASKGRGKPGAASRSASDQRTHEVIWEAGTTNPASGHDYPGTLCSGDRSKSQSLAPTPRKQSQFLSDFLQVTSSGHGRGGAVSRSASDVTARDILWQVGSPCLASEEEADTPNLPGQESCIVTCRERSKIKRMLGESQSLASSAFDPNNAISSINDWSWQLPDIEDPDIASSFDSNSSNSIDPITPKEPSRAPSHTGQPQIRPSRSESMISRGSSLKRLRSVKSASAAASEVPDVVSFPPLSTRTTTEWFRPLPEIVMSRPSSSSPAVQQAVTPGTSTSVSRSISPRHDGMIFKPSPVRSLYDAGIDARGTVVAYPVTVNGSWAGLMASEPSSLWFRFDEDYQIRRRSVVKCHPNAPARVGSRSAIGSSLGCSSGKLRKISTLSTHAQFVNNINRPSVSRLGTWLKARLYSRFPSAVPTSETSSPREDLQDPMLEISPVQGLLSGPVDRSQLVKRASPPIPTPDHVGIYESFTGAVWGHEGCRKDYIIHNCRKEGTREPSIDWIG